MSDIATATIVWTLGDKIAKARRVAGLEQAEVAAKVGVSRALVGQWENDRSEPRATQLAVLADLFGQPVGWFLNQSGCDYGVSSPFGFRENQTSLFDHLAAESAA